MQCSHVSFDNKFFISRKYNKHYYRSIKSWKKFGNKDLIVFCIWNGIEIDLCFVYGMVYELSFYYILKLRIKELEF
jgi:hypothetical protein